MQVFGCRKKMSAIAVLDYGGANELFKQMSALAQKGREDYQLYFEEEAPNGNSDIDPMVSALLHPLDQSWQRTCFRHCNIMLASYLLLHPTFSIQSIGTLLTRAEGHKVRLLGILNSCHLLDTYICALAVSQ